MEPFTCVVVGDGSCGKTCLLNSYFYKEYPQFAVTTTIDSFIIELIDDENKHRVINVYEIGNSISNNEARYIPKLFPIADLFIICYSVTSFISFKNVRNRVSTIRKINKSSPIILVATKIDIRQKEDLDDLDIRNKSVKEKESRVTNTEGESLARRVKAIRFIECSAVTKEGLQSLFETVEKELSTKKMEKKKSINCNIL